ncbi:hypothetical protein HZZ00_21610 [Streptomyces sp. NEAU-sy36]|uniref:hypothetical protein n=1 Tax=unclassified Streptomyces TaxID=2593676 RepID=UPI0015D5E95E|nr:MULTISPECIES: hypothetical protein [unclassified Streptomyces]QLJ03322.1 hypothetical protein HZZ00_21610 [Streptomyces sp. NEAU-sy36]
MSGPCHPKWFHDDHVRVERTLLDGVLDPGGGAVPGADGAPGPDGALATQRAAPYRVH